ncbi:hypothetical protein F7D01_04765 [Erythrobacter sp. 3-20A1M]|uniref:hypothetical protein n=1 Tax=Erythrobacter sp. 3-20A1M TaxID=2653850 RepID=UPI001BFC4829|nr:hypothetical protein [Erythrobacter sp. 3-20A1M]QWC56495.1 hypothetical protein F7D01_04765 [Erythrobacter sp. 3-20A1M]
MSMFQMGPAELREFSHLLQTACDQATASIPDTPTITADDTQLTFVSDVWTSAMTRDVLKVTMQKNWVHAKVSAISPIEPTATSAALVLEGLIGPTLRVQIDRWILAHDQGLMSNGIPSNLPSDRMLIDRTLAAMLGNDIERLRSAAMSLLRDRDFEIGDEMPSVPVGANNGMAVFSRQIGRGLPVVGSWITLCKDPPILFDGSYVVLDGPIPETSIFAAPSHRLKDLIDTGILSLDNRIIVAVHSLGEHAHGFTLWDEILCYYIELEPDSVPLGPCRL